MTYRHLTNRSNRKAAAIVLKSFRATLQQQRAVLRVAQPSMDGPYAVAYRLKRMAEDKIHGARNLLRLLSDTHAEETQP